MEKNKNDRINIKFIGIIFIFIVLSLMITFLISNKKGIVNGIVLPNEINSKEIVIKYSNGIYCVPNKGVAYFEKDNVPIGAILMKPIPDYTNGEYPLRLNVNFFKMMGCVK